MRCYGLGWNCCLINNPSIKWTKLREFIFNEFSRLSQEFGDSIALYLSTPWLNPPKKQICQCMYVTQVTSNTTRSACPSYRSVELISRNRFDQINWKRNTQSTNYLTWLTFVRHNSHIKGRQSKQLSSSYYGWKWEIARFFEGSMTEYLFVLELGLVRVCCPKIWRVLELDSISEFRPRCISIISHKLKIWSCEVEAHKLTTSDRFFLPISTNFSQSDGNPAYLNGKPENLMVIKYYIHT